MTGCLCCTACRTPKRRGIVSGNSKIAVQKRRVCEVSLRAVAGEASIAAAPTRKNLRRISWTQDF